MNKVCIVSELLTFFLIVVESVSDIRKREIKISYVIAISIVGIVMSLFGAKENIVSMLLGVSIGVFIYVLSIITSGGVGRGDAFMLCATGTLLGFEKNLILFLSSLLLCALFSAFLLVAFKADKNQKLPFIPFMIPGFVMLVLFRYVK